MPNPRLSYQVAILAAMLVVTSMTGCVPWARGIRSIDETVTDWRDFVWGKRAYYQRYGSDSSGPFMDGFLEGYHDMLQGGDGCLPVVPPKRYWTWKYQSSGGRGSINDWFSGYSAGVAAAKEDGLSNLNCIPLCTEYKSMDGMPIDPLPSNSGGIGEEMPSPAIEPGTTRTQNKGGLKLGMESLRRLGSKSTRRSPENVQRDTSGTKQVAKPNVQPQGNRVGSGEINRSLQLAVPAKSDQKVPNLNGGVQSTPAAKIISMPRTTNGAVTRPITETQRNFPKPAIKPAYGNDTPLSLPRQPTIQSYANPSMILPGPNSSLPPIR